jgi:GNAT superfamily N-acetyltransferase
VLQLTTYTTDTLPPAIAEVCFDCLCNSGSEMQGVFQAIAHGPPFDGWVQPAGLVISVACIIREDEVVPIAWASVSHWNEAPSIQVYVHPIYRRRGLASALVSMLTVEGSIPLETANVFSPYSITLAKRAGFRSVNEWKRVEDGWIKVSVSG